MLSSRFFNGTEIADVQKRHVCCRLCWVTSFLTHLIVEASSATAAGKMVNELVGKTVLEEVGGDIKAFFKELSDKRFIPARSVRTQPTLPVMQEQLNDVPVYGRTLRPLSRLSANVSLLTRLLSTFRLMHSPGFTERRLTPFPFTW